MKNLAIGIIDVQRGFMPASEGERLGLEGFGELPIEHGEEVLGPLNALLGAVSSYQNVDVFTTQDWHPEKTKHFSEQPDFISSWPRHCVMQTPGAELHPDLVARLKEIGLYHGNDFYYTPESRDSKNPQWRYRSFKKGYTPLEDGEEDLSYSGFYANDSGGIGEEYYVYDHLEDLHKPTVILGGLALDHCVGKTALDLRTKLGLDVTVALDATRSVSEEGAAAMLRQFEEVGVQVSDTNTLINQYFSER